VSDLADDAEAELAAAEEQLRVAESALAEAIRALRGIPRAEKTVTTRLVEDAMEHVRTSRQKLGDLRRPPG
jgi:hypothetical protein